MQGGSLEFGLRLANSHRLYIWPCFAAASRWLCNDSVCTLLLVVSQPLSGPACFKATSASAVQLLNSLRLALIVQQQLSGQTFWSAQNPWGMFWSTGSPAKQWH